MSQVDICETEHEVVLKAELAEIEVKNVSIQAEKNVLTNKGERKLSEETKEENYWRIERTCGAFSRSFTFPASVDFTGITARYKDSVLKLALLKKEELKPMKIDIELEKE